MKRLIARVVIWSERERIHQPGINGKLLALACDRDGLNAGQVRPELLEIQRGAIERVIERLFGYRELLTLRPHFGRRQLKVAELGIVIVR